MNNALICRPIPPSPTFSDSSIVNDANDYANETLGDPRYPFDLLRRVITVSLETMKIVRALPALDI